MNKTNHTSAAVSDGIEEKDPTPANFEDAIKATGYGKFNLLIMCILVPCSFAQEVEQSAIPFITPIAQCDLHLSLENKGILNSVSSAGMILSGFFWGYICDSYGRRKSAIYGYLLTSLCYILGGFTQSFTMLLVARFVSGIMFTGPFSAVTSYIAEFHSSSRRAVIQVIRGATVSVAGVILPLIAWAILPRAIFIPFTSNIVFRSWNIFLLVSCLPSLISAIIFVFMPESPKFLMTQGKNHDALQVFKLMHKMNTGETNAYPIKNLIEEKQKNIENKFNKSSLRERTVASFRTMKPLFCPPYIYKLVLVCINILALVTGVYGLRLWYPQLLQAMNDYGEEYGANKYIGMCNIVESLTYVNKTDEAECKVNTNNEKVYINSAILGTANLITYILGGFIVNRIGKKTLVATLTTIASIGPMLLYFILDTDVMLAIFPITFALGELSRNVLLTISLELFPTPFRITAVNIHLTFVRLGLVIGSVIFPYLLMLGCFSLLLCVSLSIFVTAVLTSMLPSTENKALE